MLLGVLFHHLSVGPGHKSSISNISNSSPAGNHTASPPVIYYEKYEEVSSYSQSRIKKNNSGIIELNENVSYGPIIIKS